jgi:hypothetical protein
MKDHRIDVVTAILDGWAGRGLRSELVAEQIIAALDQRVVLTKWEGPRLTLLEGRAIPEYWIPEIDLLAHLNALPGEPLTKADLKAKLVDLYSGHWSKPDPDLQAGCLRVYRREQRAGTEFLAILNAIDDEVLEPARSAQAEAARKTANSRLLESGNDFGFAARGFDETHGFKRQTRQDGSYVGGNYYGRFAGQLYRLTRKAPNQHELWCIKNVSDRGKQAKPAIFDGPKEAREAIKAGKVECR